MQTHKKVSIVINNYNYARYLRAAVQSALAQSYPSVEVIVVDDGSTDESVQVIAAFEGQVNAVYQPNRGQAAALNAGAARASGDFILFLDADDTLEPQAAASIVRAFAAHPRAVKVQFRMEVIDAAGNRSGVLKPDPRLSVPSGNLKAQALAFPFDIPWLPTSGNAFSLPALRAILPIPEDDYRPVGADWYLCQLTNLLGEVVFIDETLACYRVHSGNHYEVMEPAVNLAHIRQSIRFAHHTACHLERLARRLDIPSVPATILSVSYIANRLVSLKLSPGDHPLRDDRVPALLLLGWRSAMRRWDVSLFRRFVFAAWFLAMALAPARTAKALALWFMYPDQRPGSRSGSQSPVQNKKTAQPERAR